MISRRYLYRPLKRIVVYNTFIRNSPITFHRLVTTKPFFDENPKLSIGTKVSNFLTSFIEEDEPLPSVDQVTQFTTPAQKLSVEELIRHHPKLHKDLTLTIDPQNKLFILLAYDPVMIDPQLYLHYYQFVANLETTTKRLLVHRLLFHKQYEQCWQLFTESYTSLSELDEYVDIACTYLTKLDNEFLKVEFLSTLSLSESEQNLRASILTSIEHHLKITSAEIEEILDFWSYVNNLNTLEELETYYNGIDRDNNYLRTLYLKRVMTMLQYDPELSKQTVAKYLMESPNITSSKGWLSSIFPQYLGSTYLHSFGTPTEIQPFVQSINLLPRDSLEQLTKSDVVYILNANVINPYALFSIIHGTSLCSIKPIANHIMKKILERQRYSEIRAVFLSSYKALDSEYVAKCIHIQFNESLDDFKESVKLIKRHFDAETSASIFDKFISTSEIDLNQLHSLLLMFMFLPKQARGAIKQFTHHQPSPDVNDLIRIILDPKLTSRHIILELFRAGILRMNIRDSVFISLVLNKLLEYTIPKSIIKSRDDPTREFDALFHAYGEKARIQFHHAIRAYAQTLSLLPADEIARILDVLTTFCSTESFYYAGDEYARRYIMKAVTKDMLRFIERARKDSPKELAEFLRTIIDNMTTHKRWVKHSFFRAVVLDDYRNALKLIEHYKDNEKEISNYIPAIMSGLLKNESININKRIQLIDELLLTWKEMGYKHTIKITTAHEILHTLRIESKRQNLNSDSVAWLSEMSRESFYLRDVIKNCYKNGPRKKGI
ncbi:uncharacterized protein J8A68_004979 [[Candida] subhashii]|uniref:Uncharacterized protein n=1 Tax=[Candida] subhashii TaxID=561895 RepID=A0A8J5UUA0_9ASCO|nr:uncharacterized protein J8A68_004979 [[Candida] subhashii]KAG7661520.1 hypothetical protein J8A68_004979 [[Candida] subhashii]